MGSVSLRYRYTQQPSPTLPLFPPSDVTQGRQRLRLATIPPLAFISGQPRSRRNTAFDFTSFSSSLTSDEHRLTRRFPPFFRLPSDPIPPLFRVRNLTYRMTPVNYGYNRQRDAIPHVRNEKEKKKQKKDEEAELKLLCAWKAERKMTPKERNFTLHSYLFSMPFISQFSHLSF